MRNHNNIKIEDIIENTANPVLIGKAFEFAKKAHGEQKRKSGENYIEHPLRTAFILSKMGLDSKIIAAAILHDVVDDTPTTNDEIKKEFGKEIAFLVEGITKLGKIKYRGIKRHIENLRKMFLAMAEDIRVVLIKLADRLDNMETLSVHPPEKAKRIAMETLEIYAPLAHRLGIGEFKWKLEDLSFPYIYPEEHKKLTDEVKDKYEDRKKYLEKIKPIINKELAKENIREIEIYSRAKYYYSLYKKLQRYNMDLNKIYDLVALRIIVENVEDCYKVLSIIHKLWTPVPGRIKDYIAFPKPNGYQSLHTTVTCLDGKITEFQIRTQKMQKEAEFGIAAHWYYSEQKGLKGYIKKLLAKPPEKDIAWIKRLQEWQKESETLSPEEYLESLKIDFFKDRVFVFTPKGDIIDLPEGATPIDFAYRIHTDVGHKCVGAKVDGKLISLDQPLKNGQKVEILTQKKENVNRDWLKVVKTSFAKSRIKNWLEKKSQPEAFAKGSETLNQKFQEIFGVSLKSLPQGKKEKILSVLPYKNFESLIAAFGREEVKWPQIFRILSEEKKETKETLPQIKIAQKPGARAKIQVAGQNGILIKLAQCCHPSPQDNEETAAFITKTKGASIHKTTCQNFQRLAKMFPEKVISASWKDSLHSV